MNAEEPTLPEIMAEPQKAEAYAAKHVGVTAISLEKLGLAEVVYSKVESLTPPSSLTGTLPDPAGAVPHGSLGGRTLRSTVASGEPVPAGGKVITSRGLIESWQGETSPGSPQNSEETREKTY